MNRHIARSAGWLLALVFSIALGACGGDEHKNMDHGAGSGPSK